jgi:PAS domain S-box-containing protein
MPPTYDKMNRAQLIAELRHRDAQARQPHHLEDVVHELQVHQEEIRVQNEHLKEVQQSLEESRDRYADLYDFAPMGYMMLDRSGVITETNLTAAMMFGLERGKLIGNPLLLYVSATDRDAFLDHVNRCRQGHGDEVRTELEIVHRDGRTVPVSLASRVPRDAATSASAEFRTALIDLTQQRQAERERRELLDRERIAHARSEAKDRFLAILSHELRTPLTPVLAAVSALEEQRVPKSLAPTLRMIRRNVQMEADLIDDLLDITRINRNMLKLDLGDVDVHALINEVIDMCQPEIQDRRMNVELRAGATHCVVRADLKRLRQVIWNLLRNAIKFTPARGSITITTDHPQSDRLRIVVADTGMGIAPPLAGRIFQPFEQAEAANGDRAAGLGLGLAICKALVDAHGGEISVFSEGPGLGTAFTVILPCLPQSAVATPVAAPARAPLPARRAAAAGHGLKILLVEDHPDTVHIMTKLLRARGHRVRSASSVKDALATAASETFDLLISDIGLPDGTGLQLMTALKKSAHAPRQGIAISGFGSEEDLRKSAAAGFDHHLVKPVDFGRLNKIIAQIASGQKKK